MWHSTSKLLSVLQVVLTSQSLFSLSVTTILSPSLKPSSSLWSGSQSYSATTIIRVWEGRKEKGRREREGGRGERRERGKEGEGKRVGMNKHKRLTVAFSVRKAYFW